MSTLSDYAIDTNAAIAMMERQGALRSQLGGDATFHISIVALGELYFGAEHSSRPTHNAARVDAFRSTLQLLLFDIETARHYGSIHHLLRTKGQPIPENDMWIAASAMRHGLPLVTRDKHFQHVEGLQIVSW